MAISLFNEKRVKFFLALLFSCIVFTACSPGKHVTSDENILGVSKMYYTMNVVLGSSQLDSLIRADKLTNLNEWIYSPLIGNDQKRINQWLYIKSVNPNSEFIYTVTQMQIDTLFKCTKRVTEVK